MRMRRMGIEESVGAGRGEVVVCIPVHNGYEHFVECLTSVLAHTNSSVPILVADDASGDTRIADFLTRLVERESSAHELLYLRRPHNGGFPKNVNGAFAAAAPADVVVLNSDCAVAEGWLEGLRDAAYADSRNATATALTNNGTLVSVPERRRPGPLPQEWSLDDAAAAVRANSLRLRPRLPTAVGHCMYVRRSALELVGDFDLAFSPGYGEEVDFSQRCLRRGLTHVVADDVLVLHHGGVSFGKDERTAALQREHERLIAARYPYYHGWVQALERDTSGRLARALSAARRSLRRLSLVVDGRVLSGPMTGTQLQILEVIGALARTDAVELSVIVPDDPGDYASTTLASLPQVRVVGHSHADALARRPADVVHRPYQVAGEEDLRFLAPLGERLVITNQDLIAFHNPSYFDDGFRWQAYREVTRAALATADRVVFVSDHARRDALAEDLLEPGRASVVHNGVDHWMVGANSRSIRPRGLEELAPDVQMIVCLGTDFRHKNRVFAVEMVRELRQRHGWDGLLVLAGPRVTRGSSVPEEAELLAVDAALGSAVRHVGALSEPEKNWLLEQATLVVYPTVHEGFGLVPFEAAAGDVPCTWAPGTALAEVLPTDLPDLLVPWDVSESADRALRLLRDEQARRANVEAIRAVGRALTWDGAAQKLLQIYAETCAAPASPAAPLERRMGGLTGVLSDDALRLIGPRGALAPEYERPLLALVTHPRLGDPVLGAIRLGYRASFTVRRRLARQRGRAVTPSAETTTRIRSIRKLWGRSALPPGERSVETEVEAMSSRKA